MIQVKGIVSQVTTVTVFTDGNQLGADILNASEDITALSRLDQIRLDQIRLDQIRLDYYLRDYTKGTSLHEVLPQHTYIATLIYKRKL